MFKLNIRHALLSLSALGLIVAFQNCAPEMGFETASRNLDSITASDNFASLSEDDHEIATKTAISNFSPPLADRQVVTGILTHAFGPSFATVNGMNLPGRAPDFGKSCSIYEEHYVSANGQRALGSGVEVCRTSSPNFADANATQGSTPSRSAYLMRACSNLVENNTTLNYFINQLGKKEERENFETGSIIKAYSLFYIGKPHPSTGLIEAIRFIGTNQPDPVKAWAAIAFTLCTSEHWQVL